MKKTYAPFLMPPRKNAAAAQLQFPLVSDNMVYSSMVTRSVVEGLAVRFPFLETGSIGRSTLGTELMYIRIGRGEKEVCYQASIHANEWITTPILLKFAEEYAESLSAQGDLYGVPTSYLYEQYSLYLIPLMNPDGVDLVTGALTDANALERTSQIAEAYPQIPYPQGWKANIDGIDLNLQFPAGWENARQIKYEQGFTTPAPRDYVGEAPLTAVESRSLYEFTLEHDFRLTLSYHTQGEVIYWKYLNYEPEGSRRIAEYFGYVSGYQVEETPYSSGYAGYKDWFIQDYNRPGYTIEAGQGENPLPIALFPQIYEANKGILLGGMTEI